MVAYPFAYSPASTRPANVEYDKLLRRLLREGVPVSPQQESGAYMILGHQMRFNILADGFPIITQRDLVTPSKKTGRSIFSQAIGELCAFLNGVYTQEGLKRFGCHWWGSWVTKEKCEKRNLSTGDLGPGSYGPAWTTFPTSEGVPFDQIHHVIEQIKELPHLRTHFVSPWIPQYIGRGEGKQQRVVVAPCHGWLHFVVFPAQGRISLHHFQRSADVPVGLVANLIQYAALLLMVAQVTGYTPWELVYTLSDAHYYSGQEEAIRLMLKQPLRPFCTVTLDGQKDINDFRSEHFHVSDYHPTHASFRIPTPV